MCCKNKALYLDNNKSRELHALITFRPQIQAFQIQIQISYVNKYWSHGSPVILGRYVRAF